MFYYNYNKIIANVLLILCAKVVNLASMIANLTTTRKLDKKHPVLSPHHHHVIHFDHTTYFQVLHTLANCNHVVKSFTSTSAPFTGRSKKKENAELGFGEQSALLCSCCAE